jgi:hypothetical protein
VAAARIAEPNKWEFPWFQAFQWVTLALVDRHFTYIGAAMKTNDGRNYQLWDENDGFFCDVLRFTNGGFRKLRWLAGRVNSAFCH